MARLATGGTRLTIRLEPPVVYEPTGDSQDEAKEIGPAQPACRGGQVQKSGRSCPERKGAASGSKNGIAAGVWRNG